MRSRVQLLLATGLILSANVVRAAVITLTVGPTGQFASINAATSFADTDANPNNSYDILVAPGTYTNDFSNVTRPMTIEAATPRSQVLLLATVPPPNLKAIIWTDSSLTVNGLTFEGAAISSSDGGNGAGIRDQSNTATSLVVENSRFVGNQEGILTGSDSGQTFAETVIITNSQFINNGNPDPNAFQHALYVGDAGSLRVSNSLFCGQLLGHDVKSRALSTTVQNSTMYIGAAASPSSPDYYNAGCTTPGSTSIGVDIPNGGNAHLVGDALIQGPANQNGALVSYGEEGLHSSDGNTFAISDSAFTSTANGLAIQELPTCLAPVTLTNDMFTGTNAIINQSNCLIYADILWQNTNGTVAIWEMNGATVIADPVIGNPGPSWHAIGRGDFYGNGPSDILWQNTDGTVAIWEMNGATVIADPIIANPGPRWHVIGSGDFYGNGRSDILWQNTDGTVAIWEMNGATVIADPVIANPGPSWQAIGSGDFYGNG